MEHNFYTVCYWNEKLGRQIYAVYDGTHIIAEFHDTSVWAGYNAEDEADEFLERLTENTELWETT